MTDIHNDYDAPVQYAFRFLCSICGRIDEKSVNVRSGDMVFKPWPGTSEDPWMPIGRRWVCGNHKIRTLIDGEEFHPDYGMSVDSLCPPKTALQ